MLVDTIFSFKIFLLVELYASRYAVFDKSGDTMLRVQGEKIDAAVSYSTFLRKRGGNSISIIPWFIYQDFLDSCRKLVTQSQIWLPSG